MIKEILARVLEHRYIWRTAGFTELSELYISNLLRVFALSILVVFVPFYMYQNGYPAFSIFTMYGLVFVARAISDIAAAFAVARFGPKHILIVSCFLQILSAGLFLTIPAHHWPVAVLSIPWGVAVSSYFIAYHVAFSKVKHTEHAGKELGTMQVMEKLGGVAGPIVGGVVGTVLGAHYIFLLATIILVASLWPLFQTSEPVRTKQILRYSNLPLQKIKYDLESYVALGVENVICINVWPFYVALFALSGGVYAKLGAVTASAVLVSIFAAYFAGRLIDSHKGYRLLRISAVLNAILYIFRPLANGIWPVLGINLVNESITTGYRIPYIKGMYVAADDLPGYRICYISTMECTASIAKGTLFFLLALLATLFPVRSVLVFGFGVAALGSLLIMLERFKGLRQRSTIKS